MKSPFPGMDPFIEACGLWEDFHGDLIAEIKRSLASLLPEKYIVRTGERSYVVMTAPHGGDNDDEEFQMIPDAAVIAAQASSGNEAAGSATAVAESPTESRAPVRMKALIESEITERFLEITQFEPERRLVTGIEILSPSNKRHGTTGWRQYLRKRQAFLEGMANFVEIDLLRGGSRMPMHDPWPPSPYYLLVSRKEESPNCRVWPATSEAPLPEIPVPLDPADSDVLLDLNPLIAEVARHSRYDVDIDYSKPINLPLTERERSLLRDLNS